MTAAINEFDSVEDEPLTYTWRGKLNLLPRPAAFTFCQVKAESYADLTMRLYSNGSLLVEIAVVDSEPFTLPLGNEYERFEVEFTGTSRVYTAQFVEDIAELE